MVVLGPLGFRAQPAHPWALCGNHTVSLCGNHTEPAGGGCRRAGGRANSDPTGVHPPTQDCYPPAGGEECNILSFMAQTALHAAMQVGAPRGGEKPRVEWERAHQVASEARMNAQTIDEEGFPEGSAA